MNVTDPAQCSVITDDHPTGVLGFRYLLAGQPNTPENYMMQIAENLGHFEMVTHRHNFDQFRYVIKGQMNLGGGRVLREGELCYFPEGTSYGPQDDAAGPIVLVLQFGGASGYGYMSPQQYREGRELLCRDGYFDGPIYKHKSADGRLHKKFSINAIWEASMGTRLLIPAPRYDQIIIMRPSAYRWTPMAGVEKTFRKQLGIFTERGTRAELWRLLSGASATLGRSNAIRILFVTLGQGTIGGRPLRPHFGADLQPEEEGILSATTDMELLVFTLPLLSTSWSDPDLPSTEPVPGESVQEPERVAKHALGAGLVDDSGAVR